MSEPLQREWRFYIDDMIGFCRKVLSYTQDLDATTFAGSGVHYDATLRNIELIGEAATHIRNPFALHTLASPGARRLPPATA